MGTEPVPETLRDWFAGQPGKTEALPYFVTPEEVEATRKDVGVCREIQVRDEGALEVVASCGLPTVEEE
jgi:hypothetical protein